MKFTRADTYKFKFQRRDFNNEVILTKAEKLWFTVKKNYKTETILIQKTLQDGTIVFDDEGFYHIEIKPEDTYQLKYKKYVCDIQVENNGEVTTIYKGTVELDNEVTFMSKSSDVEVPPENPTLSEEQLLKLKTDLKAYIDTSIAGLSSQLNANIGTSVQNALENFNVEVPNASSTVCGGIKTYYDADNKALYITNDGSSPIPTSSVSEGS